MVADRGRATRGPAVAAGGAPVQFLCLFAVIDSNLVRSSQLKGYVDTVIRMYFRVKNNNKSV